MTNQIPPEGNTTMIATDWRSAPAPQACTDCGAPRSTCDGKRMLSGRRCCSSCNHNDQTTNEGTES